MSIRTSISVEGIDHGASPFPVASRVGPFIFSSAIAGRAPGDQSLAPDLETQARLAFANVERVVAASGATAADIVKVVVFARDRSATRAAIDDPWLSLFPDPASRPVRHTIEAALPPGLHLQVEFIAVQEVSRP